MRSISLFLVTLFITCGCATKNAPVSADSVSVLRISMAVMDDFTRSNGSSRGHDDTALRQQLKIIQRNYLIENDDNLEVALRYYAAYFENTILWNENSYGRKLDYDMARDCLENIKIVIKYNVGMREWGFSLANANFIAGDVSSLIYGDTSHSLEYWDACARMNHPTCALDLAGALLRNPSSNKSDILRAIDLDAVAVKFGAQGGCASVLSAEQIAMIIHLTGVKRDGDDALEWLEESRALWREIQKVNRTKDPCEGASIGLKEFMIRMDRGERRDDLLDSVMQNSINGIWVLIAKNLHGTLSDNELWNAINAGKTGQCGVHLYSAWKAKQAGENLEARSHYDAMLKINPASCGLFTAYARWLVSPPFFAS